MTNRQYAAPPPIGIFRSISQLDGHPSRRELHGTVWRRLRSCRARAAPDQGCRGGIGRDRRCTVAVGTQAKEAGHADVRHGVAGGVDADALRRESGGVQDERRGVFATGFYAVDRQAALAITVFS